MSEIEHGPDCKPEHMSSPDWEGIRDCYGCGLWEKESRIDICRRILRDHRAEEIDGVLIDVQTANAMVTCWNAMSERSRQTFETADVARIGTFCWAQVTAV